MSSEYTVSTPVWEVQFLLFPHHQHAAIHSNTQALSTSWAGPDTVFKVSISLETAWQRNKAQITVTESLPSTISHISNACFHQRLIYLKFFIYGQHFHFITWTVVKTQRGNVRDWKIRKVLIQSFTVSWKFGIVSQISAKMLKFEQRVSQMTIVLNVRCRVTLCAYKLLTTLKFWRRSLLWALWGQS